MTLFENDTNPAMRFEGLARGVFNNCNKYGDPWGYAAQERFANFVPGPTLTGKRALSTILIKLISDHPKHELTPKLIQLEDSIWTTTSQSKIIAIIDETIKHFNKIVQ